MFILNSDNWILSTYWAWSAKQMFNHSSLCYTKQLSNSILFYLFMTIGQPWSFPTWISAGGPGLSLPVGLSKPCLLTAPKIILLIYKFHLAHLLNPFWWFPIAYMIKTMLCPRPFTTYSLPNFSASFLSMSDTLQPQQTYSSSLNVTCCFTDL